MSATPGDGREQFEISPDGLPLPPSAIPPVTETLVPAETAQEAVARRAWRLSLDDNERQKTVNSIISRSPE